MKLNLKFKIVVSCVGARCIVPLHEPLKFFENSSYVSFHIERIKERYADGKEHAGVLIALEHLQGGHGAGRIVEEVVFIHQAIQGGAATLQNDVYNRVSWIS